MRTDVRRVASRVVWWEAPERAVARLRLALRAASPGIFDLRSWHYWHARLGLGEPGPLPSRHFA